MPNVLNRRVTLASVFLIVAFLVVAGVLFWPGLYQYQEIKETLNGVPTTAFGRINRLTGSTQELIGGRWIGIAHARELPPRERAQLVGYAGLGQDGIFSGNIHNGSRWTVTQVIVRVDGQAQRPRPDANPGPWSHTVVVDLRMLPDSTTVFRVPATDQREITERQIVMRGWLITKAYGSPP